MSDKPTKKELKATESTLKAVKEGHWPPKELNQFRKNTASLSNFGKRIPGYPPKLPKGTISKRLEVRVPTHDKKAVVILGNEPSASTLKETKRSQMSELAKYLRTSPGTIRRWTPRAVETLKLVGKAAGKLGAVSALASLPSQIEEFRKAVDPEERQRARSLKYAKRM